MEEERDRAEGTSGARVEHVTQTHCSKSGESNYSGTAQFCGLELSLSNALSVMVIYCTYYHAFSQQTGVPNGGSPSRPVKERQGRRRKDRETESASCQLKRCWRRLARTLDLPKLTQNFFDLAPKPIFLEVHCETPTMHKLGRLVRLPKVQHSTVCRQDISQGLFHEFQKAADKGLTSYYLNQNIKLIPPLAAMGYASITTSSRKSSQPVAMLLRDRFWRPWMLEPDGPTWIRNCLESRGFKTDICKARSVWLGGAGCARVE